MLGAHALLTSLVDAGVDVCFMNPGTSEMHFVQALDAVPAMRGVLTLFEGVATGAADGYARMTGRPAAALLHLGPGLGNGLANLHNARRAHTPMLCIVGAHATGHVRYDAPLQTDIEATARTVSGWVHTAGTTRGLADDAMRALQSTALDGGQVATLILPADVSWSDGALPAAPRPQPAPSRAGTAVIGGIAELLADPSRSTILLGGPALTEAGLRDATRIAVATGATLLTETFPARMECGRGLPTVPRLAYLAEEADRQLAGTEQLILAGAASPVSFFAYPGRSSDLVPAGCDVHTLADRSQDVETALADLAAHLGADQAAAAPDEPAADIDPGLLTATNLAAAIAASLPEHAIVVDEAITSGWALPQALASAPRHSLLTLTGGAIGQGLPAATGAAIAAPNRNVLAVQADGSALYTIQALWTQARERLDVTTVLVNNAAYAILRVELQRTGAGATGGDRARRMLDLSDPTPNFTDLGHGFGVPAVRVTTGAELDQALRRAYAEPGPHLIEAMVAPVA